MCTLIENRKFSTGPKANSYISKPPISISMGNSTSSERALQTKLAKSHASLRRSREALQKLRGSWGTGGIIMGPSLDPGCPALGSKQNEVAHFNNATEGCGSRREDEPNCLLCEGGVVAVISCSSNARVKFALYEEPLKLRPIGQDIHEEKQQEQAPDHPQYKAYHDQCTVKDDFESHPLKRNKVSLIYARS